MNNSDKNYFRNKLQNEKKELEKKLNSTKNMDLLNENGGIRSELSHYDNHTGDEGSELYQIEKEIALEKNQKNMLDKINKELMRLENGDYGICSHCGTEISKKRLDIIPYTNLCSSCSNEESHLIKSFNSNKSSEERIIGIPFNFENSDNINEFDEEDTLRKLENFNSIKDGEELEQDVICVENIEKISNTQYKNTLE
ncbi:TraR/DksA C4-type zinc finger protein [Clostridium sp. DL1XJH146]